MTIFFLPTWQIKKNWEDFRSILKMSIDMNADEIGPIFLEYNPIWSYLIFPVISLYGFQYLTETLCIFRRNIATF